MIFILFLKLSFEFVFLEENFSSNWESRWLKPQKVRKSIRLGLFRLTAGSFFADEIKSRGIQTIQYGNYLIASNLTRILDTTNQTLIVSYTVRQDQYVDCAGSYIKLFPITADSNSFDNRTDYSIMFGPDICGATLHSTKLIFQYKQRHFSLKNEIVFSRII